MDAQVVRLGAWCDLETAEDVLRRLAPPLEPVGDGPADTAGQAQPGVFRPSPGWSPQEDGSPGLQFVVEEFAVLADGRRLRLHAERGFGLSTAIGGSRRPDPWEHLDLAGLEADVLTTVLPDDAEETGESHPWEWLAALLSSQGVEVSPAELRELPYDVEFSGRLRARLRDGA